MKIRAMHERGTGMRLCLSGLLSVLFVMSENPSATAYGGGPPPFRKGGLAGRRGAVRLGGVGARRTVAGDRSV